MQPNANILKMNNLSATTQAPRAVSNAIQKASLRTGVDFAYLMDQAKAESSYNPAAKAKTSSASGLFQFIERTWLDMVNRHGDKYGLSAYADQIDDKLRIGDKAARRDILALRNDPQVASYMAAEFAAENKAFLERNVGGDIGSTELYFAHFLGASGATGFLKELRHNPMTIGADIMPEAARANRNVFYDSKTGQPRTLQHIYYFFDKKFTDDAPMPGMMTAEKNTPSAEQVIAAREKPVVYRDSFVPVKKSPVVVDYYAPPARSLAATLSEDQVPRAMTLDDYRDNPNRQYATRVAPPAQNMPMSIADLLMLSAVDL